MKTLALTLLLYSPFLLAFDYGGDIDLQARAYYEKGNNPKQKQLDTSISLEPELSYAWNNDREVITFKPFFRADSVDPERTHGDIRQLDWVKATEQWEFRLGIRKVFWGVTESNHLVDVINQTDFVENFDGEQKLGQPMVNIAWVKDFGTFDFFILPFFRERTFPGEKGRLSFGLPILKNPTYESSDKDKHIDLAFRWSKSIGWFDLALSHFYGTSREPIFQFVPGPSPSLNPHYTLMNQTGLEVQMTYESWLVKFEMISRDWNQTKDFVGAVGGFEYTLANISNTGSDLGLIIEYLYDSRKNASPTTPFENDIFAGARFALNDEEDLQILAGGIFDLDTNSKFLNLEASRRFGNHYKLTVESRSFMDFDKNDFIAAFKDESYTQIELTYSF